MLMLGTIVLSLLLSVPSSYFFYKLNPPIKHTWIYMILPVAKWWLLLFLNIGHHTAFGIVFELAIVIFTAFIIVFVWSIMTWKHGKKIYTKLRPIIVIILITLPIILRHVYPPLYS